MPYMVLFQCLIWYYFYALYGIISMPYMVLFQCLIWYYFYYQTGADITDYFNYGFTEETWRLYCEKQRKMRFEVSQLNKLAVSITNFFTPTRLSSRLTKLSRYLYMYLYACICHKGTVLIILHLYGIYITCIHFTKIEFLVCTDTSDLSSLILH